jgi:pyruvate kinase
MEATMTQEELYENVEQEILARGFAEPGDPIIITSAVPVGCGAQTNQMKIHHISL